MLGDELSCGGHNFLGQQRANVQVVEELLKIRPRSTHPQCGGREADQSAIDNKWNSGGSSAGRDCSFLRRRFPPRRSGGFGPKIRGNRSLPRLRK